MINSLNMNIKLTLNLIPQTTWYKSVRSHIPRTKWDLIRKKIYQQANYTCEVCGINEQTYQGYKKGWLHCNELWEFKDGKQILTKLEAICRDCHLVKHFGYANASNQTEKAFKHLLKVNEWDIETGNKYIEQQFKEWEERSKVDWEINYQLINYFI